MKKLSNYRRFFSESAFWGKLRRFASAAGVKTVYSALLLYYAFKRDETPAWAKRSIVGVLGYLITPLDVLPDLTPLVGYTDDIGVLGMCLVMVAAYINDDVRMQAREHLARWFPSVQESDLIEVEEKL
ncbi:DUF1232 domain-containing protein [Neolewinella aurantiaca]|uniref:DUF1232 domain-containing protein n=1 Tax=Neolewinella aurantiaca TaxID=2602767 RepID=A0A5C7G0T7_9BACT|nr:YkvA family protein [Neolewinella aurantiaca]TXF91369.1 DUF1232 domain-containing protein [Neolewinella aurantiaca]